MDMRDVHLSNIREHAAKLRKIADGYERLAVMAEAEESQLAPLVDKAGAIVVDGMDRTGALLECLVRGCGTRETEGE